MQHVRCKNDRLTATTVYIPSDFQSLFRLFYGRGLKEGNGTELILVKANFLESYLSIWLMGSSGRHKYRLPSKHSSIRAFVWKCMVHNAKYVVAFSAIPWTYLLSYVEHFGFARVYSTFLCHS